MTRLNSRHVMCLAVALALCSQAEAQTNEVHDSLSLHEVSIVGGGASLSKGGRTVCATVESGGGAWSVASAQPGNSWESPNPGMRQLVCTATVPESGELVLGISFREVK